jgi:hypothetical protein
VGPSPSLTDAAEANEDDRPLEELRAWLWTAPGIPTAISMLLAPLSLRKP